MTGPVTIADAQQLFDAKPGWLNTASYGLPPRPAWEAFQASLTEWRHGHTSWEPWVESSDAARASFARLVGAGVEDVAIGANVSALVGLVAGSLPPGSRVLAPTVEFTSNLFPYLVQADRGVVVDTVPLAELVDRIDETVDVVALSAVQSSTGEVTDLDEVSRRAREAKALLVVDATQAVGWLPVDVATIDVMACAAYKWLCSPRGTAFLYVRPELRDRFVPAAAGWFAGEDVHSSYYGPPLRLADDARRFDVSPAWHCWVGTAPALELVEQVGVERIRQHNVRLANRFRAGLGMSASDSAIVAADVPEAERRLSAAGVRAASRAGSSRASFHLYSTDADVDAALAALTG